MKNTYSISRMRTMNKNYENIKRHTCVIKNKGAWNYSKRNEFLNIEDTYFHYKLEQLILTEIIFLILMTRSREDDLL